jgi:hypothetical protein
LPAGERTLRVVGDIDRFGAFRALLGWAVYQKGVPALLLVGHWIGPGTVPWL